MRIISTTMLKNFFLILIGLPLVLLAFLQVYTYDHVLWWKATVFATEYAHYLALVVLFWGYLLPRKFWSYSVQIAFVVIFLIPTYQAEKLASRLKHRLSFKELFIGYTNRERPPHTFVYKTLGHEVLKFDFYPTAAAKSAWVMVIHGGGWDSGDRTQLSEWNYFLSQQKQNGVAVFAVDYRLAPTFHWPDQRSDIADAIRFIRKKSAEFKIDPDHYFLLGRSAGGQLAATVAYRYQELGLPKPRGVILLYAPTDMTFGYEVAEPHDLIESRTLITNFMGGEPLDKVDLYKDASPTMLVTADSPPTLLLHGRADNLSWFKHSERLVRRLTALKVPNLYVELPWATHGFDFNVYGPGGQVARFAIYDFINSH